MDSVRLTGGLAALLSMCLAASPGSAQPVKPPIRPGLWEVQQTRERDGQPVPDATQRMKNMPPEMRQRMEEQMRAYGVQMGDGGTMKICLTPEKLSRDDWASERQASNCKTEMLSRTSELWKWRSTCPDALTSEGEVRFMGETAYKALVDSTTQRGGQTHKSHIEMNGKWISADCGVLTPTESGGGGARRAKP
jgi:hypothetical protein